MKIIFILSCLMVSFTLCAADLRETMTADIDFIKNVFVDVYAPRELKKAFLHWDLVLEANKIKEAISKLKHPTIKNYQVLLKNFFNSARDYHVSVFFYSTEKARLPIRVKGVGERYFVTYVDTSKLSGMAHPIVEGQELVTLDGRPTHEVIKELMAEEFCSRETLTDYRLAEIFLTTRHGSRGMIVPKGPITLELRSPGSDEVHEVQLIWAYTPEKIYPSKKKAISKGLLPARKSLKERLSLSMLLPDFAKGLNKEMIASPKSKDFLATRESFIPPLGEVWWESEEKSKFHAYIYENDLRQRIGYIRIPHFSAGDEHLKEFKEIIEKFQKRTDALVIDQINNPGGNLLYTYAITSMLTNKPIKVPRQRVVITQSEVADAVDSIEELENITNDEEAVKALGETVWGFPVTHQLTQFLLHYSRFIVSEWDAGRTLTEPTYLFAWDSIQPHKDVRYTKPIMIVINALDFSCGDLFPAWMQDNKRALLFGEQTGGAGGYITGISYPNRLGIEYFTYTGSIAERHDKTHIENIGVTPDISYTLTVEDYQSGFQGYKDAINSAVKTLLPK